MPPRTVDGGGDRYGDLGQPRPQRLGGKGGEQRILYRTLDGRQQCDTLWA
jgi:hypothetical protein